MSSDDEDLGDHEDDPEVDPVAQDKLLGDSEHDGDVIMEDAEESEKGEESDPVPSGTD